MTDFPRKLNIGCGPHWRDAPDGWDHLDLHDYGQQYVADVRYPLTSWIPKIETEYDIVVMNHALHMIEHEDVDIALANIYRIMATGGVLRIIERNVFEAFEAYATDNDEWFDTIVDPRCESISEKFCAWLTWYSTVRTVWTARALAFWLHRAGFEVTHGGISHEQTALWHDLSITELDSRPKESFIVEARK
jgi:predicted SAM-dependent methyltransferase